MRMFPWGPRREFVCLLSLEVCWPYHVACEGVCLPLKFGGVGLKRVKELNAALLYKGFWHLKEERLWVRSVEDNFSVENGGFFPKLKKCSIRCSVCVAYQRWQSSSNTLLVSRPAMEATYSSGKTNGVPATL